MDIVASYACANSIVVLLQSDVHGHCCAPKKTACSHDNQGLSLNGMLCDK